MIFEALFANILFTGFSIPIAISVNASSRFAYSATGFAFRGRDRVIPGFYFAGAFQNF
jgi:hypothetical protein